MTPEQIRVVQVTWLKVLPYKGVAARLFYNRLFAIDPSLRTLFQSDLHVQGAKLMQIIDTAVNGLDGSSQISTEINELGRRHSAYGVEENHYDAAGTALFWTLGQCLGANFTTEVEDAWRRVYAEIAKTMKDASPRTSI
jgi:hemoglobin-like flavoprotein